MREQLRLAVVQYGNAPHRKTHTELQADGYQQYQKLCAPSHRTNVLAPLRAAGVMVHSFLHSWVRSDDHKLALLLRTEADPGAVLLLEPELPMETLCSIMKSNLSLPLSHCGLIGALMSMERGLRLALHGNRSRMHLRRTQYYDWLLLRRLDLVQYRKFDLAGLSPSLFYLSNDCDVTWVGFVKGNGTFEMGSAGMFTSAPLSNINLSLPRMSCLRTVPHRQSHPATAGERLRVQGRAQPQVSTAANKMPVSNSAGGDWFDRDFWEVPDFNFLSSPENMERVFCGLLAHSGASRPPQPASDYFKASHLGGRIAPSAVRSRDLTLHKLLAWRLTEVGLEDRLARFQYHALDYSLARAGWLPHFSEKEAASLAEITYGPGVNRSIFASPMLWAQVTAAKRLELLPQGPSQTSVDRWSRCELGETFACILGQASQAIRYAVHVVPKQKWVEEWIHIGKNLSAETTKSCHTPGLGQGHRQR